MRLSEADLAELADQFRETEYTIDPVLERLGDSANEGLLRNITLAAQGALGADRDPQATLVRLFMLQHTLPANEVRAALGRLVSPLVEAGYLTAVGEGVRAGIEVRPYGAQQKDEWSGWVCHDLTPGLDGSVSQVRHDFVLGVSPASTTLAQMTIREPVGSALDLGTGCGVQSLHLSRHADRVTATDVNPRALELARMTAGLNQVEVDIREGSLYEPVRGERFDLIVSNPPYVMSPPAEQRLTYREGDLPADELVRRVVVGAPTMLKPGGTMQVLANWAIADEPWQERLAGWIEPTGCDALVLERERLDVYSYIEMWLADAGLSASPEYLGRYQEWLDYFDHLGIRGVGMGWISLRAGGSPAPSLRFEEWPHAVHQPVGEAFAAHWRGVDLAAAGADTLLGRAWVLDRRVTQETLGRPGAADPEHVILRQGYGLGRAAEVDTALAAIVGACDGELTGSQLVEAVASLLDVDPEALAREVSPRLAELIADGYLHD